MTKIKLKVMVRAAQLRISAGETLEDVLASWPALTDDDKDQIRAELGGAPHD